MLQKWGWNVFYECTVGCIHVAVTVLYQNYVNKEWRKCYVQAVCVHLVWPSILAHIVGQFFSSSTSESSLKLEGNADCQLFCSTRKPSVHASIAINVLSAMWSNNVGRCSNFVCNSERDTPVRTLVRKFDVWLFWTVCSIALRMVIIEPFQMCHIPRRGNCWN